MEEEIKLLIAGLGMGWGPCLAYWTPMLLPYIAAIQREVSESLKISLLFTFGRLLALTLLGFLAVTFFAYVNRFFPPHRSCYLHIAVAALIMLMGILVAHGRGFRIPLHHAAEKHITPGERYILILGFLIGASPCAILVSILTYIAYVATNPIQGIVYALSFGIGTSIPIITLGTLTGFASESFSKLGRYMKFIRIICGVIIVIFGGYLLYSILVILR